MPTSSNITRVTWETFASAGGAKRGSGKLELISVIQLGGKWLDEVREQVLALEQHAYEISPDVYAHTTPMGR